MRGRTFEHVQGVIGMCLLIRAAESFSAADALLGFVCLISGASMLVMALL